MGSLLLIMFLHQTMLQDTVRIPLVSLKMIPNNNMLWLIDGYLYSEVFATDMFKTIFEADPMDPEKGKLYREKILQPGGSKDPMELLVDFLGREPTSDAFLEQLMEGAE